MKSRVLRVHLLHKSGDRNTVAETWCSRRGRLIDFKTLAAEVVTMTVTAELNEVTCLACMNSFLKANPQ